MPPGKPDVAANKDLVTDLISSSRPVRSISLSASVKPAEAISPVAVYSFEISDASVPVTCGKKRRCSVKFMFELVNEAKSCQFRFICPELEGNICGDYGVVVGVPKRKAERSVVCHESSKKESRRVVRPKLILSRYYQISKVRL